MKKVQNNLDDLFYLILKVPKKKDKKKINFNNLKTWDSINHIKLILAIESKFKVRINPDISVKLMSYQEIFNFLKNKY
jgi:acyl carrier protein|tara:strand:- start:86 stop:319 length:234 start_codon:yes stop_codon:yes gene_type:complete